MAENSAIEWCDHTFNPWIGCTKVGTGCEHCYAEQLATTRLQVPWGPGALRRRTSVRNWVIPRRWDKRAAAEGRRYRVFCSSLADVFDNEVPAEWRADLFALIRATPNLDWLLVTKRIGNAAKMAEAAGGWPANVWLGATIVNQAEADRDVPKLLEIDGPRFRFLSMEPLLGPVDLRGYIRDTGDRRAWSTWRWPSWVPQKTSARIEEFWRAEYGRGVDAWIRGAINNGQPPLGTLGNYRLCQSGSPKVTGRFIPCWNNIGVAIDTDGRAHTVSDGVYQGRPPYLDWIIVGGESGPGARPMHPDWARGLRDQCTAAGVAFLFKQWGEWLPWEPDVLPYFKSQIGELIDRHALPDADLKGWTDALSDIAVHQRVGKKAAGRLLDGVQHDGAPS